MKDMNRGSASIRSVGVVALAVVIGVAAFAASQLTASTSTVYGQPTTKTSTAGSGANNLKNPQRVFVDASGRVWVADDDNNRILMYSSVSDTTADVAIPEGDTTVAFTPGTTQAKLNGPTAVSYISGSQAQFIAVHDAGNNRVLLWVIDKDSSLADVFKDSDAATTSGETLPDIVIGQVNFTSSAGDSSIPGAPNADTANSIWPGRAAVDVELVKATSGDTIWLFVSADSSLTDTDGFRGGVFRFPLRDTFVSSGLETAVLAYSRTTNVGTPFGQAPLADVFYGGKSALTPEAFAGDTELRAFPQGISVWDGALYVADRDNHRVVRFDTVTTPGAKPDTTADAVWGQANLKTGDTGFFAGSETGLRLPVDVVVSGNGVVVGDSPANQLVSGRVVAYDGTSDTTIDRWFGMDANGNPLALTSTNASTLKGTDKGGQPFVALFGGTALAVDALQNRILLLTGALTTSLAAAEDDGTCLLGRTLGGNVPGFDAIRSVRDAALSTVVGRNLVALYYGAGILFAVGIAGLALRRRENR